MLALCVDDEALLLSSLIEAVTASPLIERAEGFRSAAEALEWSKEKKPDIAFLDISLRDSDGITLAKKLRETVPDIPVIFCTGYRDFAYDAMQIHASGYVLKPVKKNDICREIEIAVGKKHTEKVITAQTFGNFEIFINGEPIHFKRKKTKELIAYLIDRRGAKVTSGEICSVLWEDSGDVRKEMQYLYKLFADLSSSLEAVGAEKIFIKGNQEYAVDVSAIDCDYYRWLDGDEETRASFCGEYMVQYTWAEDTAVYLQLRG